MENIERFLGKKKTLTLYNSTCSVLVHLSDFDKLLK